MRISYNDDDLVKNGVTREEIKEVFFSDLSYAEELGPSARGNDRAMIIGWTFAGRILEVGVEYFDSEDEAACISRYGCRTQVLEAISKED